MDGEQKSDATKNNQTLVHDLNQQMENNSFFSAKLIIFLLVVILVGIISGYLLAQNGFKVGPVDMTKLKGSSSVSKGTVEGSSDTKVFKDSTEGVLEKGGIDGEGQYHLVRPGGESQNVYLTSSVIDLSKFTGKKIKVWGETHAAKKAGWLMDAGRVEVLE